MAGHLPTEYETLEEAVALFSREGRPQGCNRTAEELLGYDREEFAETTLSDLVAPYAELDGAEIREYLADALAGDATTFEWQLLRGNGEPRWVEATFSPYASEDRRYVLAELRDLTVHKAQERRLRLLYRVLRHNLRNEMNVIQGRAEEIHRAIQEDEVDRQLEIIRTTAENVGDLSETVADLERLVERDATERSPVNVGAVVRSLADDLRDAYPDATVETDVRAEALVSADEGFELALEHAVANAIEHNESDAPTVTISHHATDGKAVVEIADDGPGIPEMEINALEKGPTPLEHGSGLGLSVIQWCTKSLGGKVEIENAGDESGTRLRLSLPRLSERG